MSSVVERRAVAPPNQVEREHLGFLDGIRGVAALWVMLAHCMIWGGWYWPFFPDPKNAVDIFMFVSGYLMLRQWGAGDGRDHSSSISWRIFWLRRYFRIAPVFYFTLVLMFFFDTQLIEHAKLMRAANPARWASDTIYDPDYIRMDVWNMAARLTFIFGFIPRLVTATFMGDWSLTLEMQFYAAFPFLMLLVRKGRFMVMAISALLLGCVTGRFFQNMPEFRPGAGVFFPEPSFILLKLPVFVVGIGIAEAARLSRIKRNAAPGIILLSLLIANVISSWVATVAALTYFWSSNDYIINADSWIKRSREWLGGSCFRFLADCSYPLYCLHSMIIFFWGAWLLGHDYYMAQRPVLRVMILTACVAVTSYALAWVVHRLIERPGVAVGKYFSARLSVR